MLTQSGGPPRTAAHFGFEVLAQQEPCLKTDPQSFRTSKSRVMSSLWPGNHIYPRVGSHAPKGVGCDAKTSRAPDWGEGQAGRG